MCAEFKVIGVEARWLLLDLAKTFFHDFTGLQVVCRFPENLLLKVERLEVTERMDDIHR